MKNSEKNAGSMSIDGITFEKAKKLFHNLDNLRAPHSTVEARIVLTKNCLTIMAMDTDHILDTSYFILMADFFEILLNLDGETGWHND